MRTIVKYIGIFFILFIGILLLSPRGVGAQQPRNAECDACGYCFGKEAPGNWLQCKSCIYPTANDTATTNETLEIDPDFNRPKLQPAKGKYFTQLGCVDTSLSSFQDAGAAGGVLNFILSRVMFPITGILAFMSIIYGAFLLAMSQDDQMQIQRGRRFVSGGIIGALFTFSVVLIVNTIGSDILRIPGFSKGTPVTVSAAADCAINPPAGHSKCPNIVARVVNITDGSIIEEVPFGEVVGTPWDAARPQPNEFRALTAYIASDVVGITDVMVEVMIVDDWTNGLPTSDPAREDKNVYISSFEVGKNTCATLATSTSASVVATGGIEYLPMYYWNERAYCSQW